MDHPIGIFDSGVGGLSVLRPLRTFLPAEEIVYVADTAWCPYGPRPASVVRERAFAITETLLERGAKADVVACNSASTVALAALRGRYPYVPFVGMEPAVKPAAAATKTGNVGVLATATTAKGEALARLMDRFGRGVTVHVAVPEGLVELIEAGQGEAQSAEDLLAPILAHWREAGVDTVVLGCTHYPFAKSTIARLAPQVEIIDPAPAVARQTVRVLGSIAESAIRSLAGNEDARGGQVSFLTTGDAIALRESILRLVPEVWIETAAFGVLS
ncbi:MAG TPA: glutamate racemase [Chloroflexota bacterium]|nr:glutamate racemase [Chloroflexota bacterium]